MGRYRSSMVKRGIAIGAVLGTALCAIGAHAQQDVPRYDGGVPIAPTGIADYALRKPGEKTLASVVLRYGPFDAQVGQLDVSVPLDKRLGFSSGAQSFLCGRRSLWSRVQRYNGEQQHGDHRDDASHDSPVRP